MMNATTGERIDGIAHLRQSIQNILTTAIGTRVMRRDYGSLVPALVDQPDNLLAQTRVISAIMAALMRWEPRINVQQVRSLRDVRRPGYAEFEITGTYNSDFARSQPLRLRVPIAWGASA
ncbi:GPW/gp25 family protein [Comamonas sp. J-3]|uniref:GPW/gp25 family protein n=1 Tax=Comamonas trifloxystrobinivorans TaxID=3350256 RepID=UPI003727CC27